MLFEIVELSCIGSEYVNYYTVVIHQHPACAVVTLNVCGGDSVKTELIFYLIG